MWIWLVACTLPDAVDLAVQPSHDVPECDAPFSVALDGVCVDANAVRVGLSLIEGGVAVSVHGVPAASFGPAVPAEPLASEGPCGLYASEVEDADDADDADDDRACLPYGTVYASYGDAWARLDDADCTEGEQRVELVSGPAEDVYLTVSGGVGVPELVDDLRLPPSPTLTAVEPAAASVSLAPADLPTTVSVRGSEGRLVCTVPAGEAAIAVPITLWDAVGSLDEVAAVRRSSRTVVEPGSDTVLVVSATARVTWTQDE